MPWGLITLSRGASWMYAFEACSLMKTSRVDEHEISWGVTGYCLGGPGLGSMSPSCVKSGTQDDGWMRGAGGVALFGVAGVAGGGVGPGFSSTSPSMTRSLCHSSSGDGERGHFTVRLGGPQSHAFDWVSGMMPASCRS